MRHINYIHVVTKHKSLIIASILSMLIIIGVYTFTVTPIYEAQSRILITENAKSQLLGQFAMMDIISPKESLTADPVNTHIEILLTRPVLQEVIRKNNLPILDNPVSLEKFKKEFVLEPIRSTNLVKISYQNKDRHLATQIINTLMEVYVQQNQKLNQEEMTSARIFIEDQLGKKQLQLDEIESDVINYKKKQKTVSISQDTMSHVDSISKLESNKMELESTLEGALARKSDLEKKTSTPGAQANPFYGLWMNSLEETKSEITNLQAQKVRIQSQLGSLSTQLQELPTKELELAKLVREQQIANQTLTSLLTKYEEILINEAAKVASVKIVEPAIIPDKPVFPKKKINLAAALMLGSMLGYCIAFFLENFRETPGSLEDIKEALPYSFLGALPLTNESALYMRDSRHSFISEAMRLIQANMAFKEIMSQKSLTLMMTSALPAEGKTTTISNLAISLANTGKKVAVVDLDFRKPAVEKLFNLKAKNQGVTDYIIGKKTVEEIGWKVKVENLTVYPAGTIPPNPSELIISERMKQFHKWLENQYDIVLYDTAPITVVAETLIFARFVNGIIMVVDTQNTSLRALHEMQDIMKDKNLPVVGIIANRVTKETGRYSYRYSNSYYRYSYKAAKI